MFKKLEEAGLVVSQAKCKFNRKEITFPGHDIVAVKGIKPFQKKIDWPDACQTAFDKIKSMITSAPVLLMPDMSRPFRIECDANDYAVSAVLLQEDPNYNNVWKPLVSFISKTLSNAERIYPTEEQELLAILLFACQTWRCFVEGSFYLSSSFAILQVIK
ncbi:hypothetical protein [Parasitella parasitica]|uniref:Reverse transcriptase/retrotransposon-derived protein RNase H-like domain-containing protein n=1 Tax=Parasitella parasitica TaxID=35722 RepID=A0A0B7NI05_9FUNG|nr:hypothetical protein [Parasitella parasitica]